MRIFKSAPLTLECSACYIWHMICNDTNKGLINDPLLSAESNRRVFLNQESESDSEPCWSLREECEAKIDRK